MSRCTVLARSWPTAQGVTSSPHTGTHLNHGTPQLRCPYPRERTPDFRRCPPLTCLLARWTVFAYVVQILDDVQALPRSRTMASGRQRKPVPHPGRHGRGDRLRRHRLRFGRRGVRDGHQQLRAVRDRQAGPTRPEAVEPVLRTGSCRPDASGEVGTFAVQLAEAFGAEVLIAAIALLFTARTRSRGMTWCSASTAGAAGGRVCRADDRSLSAVPARPGGADPVPTDPHRPRPSDPPIAQRPTPTSAASRIPPAPSPAASADAADRQLKRRRGRFRPGRPRRSVEHHRRPHRIGQGHERFTGRRQPA